MQITSIEQITDFFNEIDNLKASDLHSLKIDFKKKIDLRIVIPQPGINSSISPVYMEAFLDLQRQIYQLAALKKNGIANANYLSEDDKRFLDTPIVVTEGSSIFELNLGEVMEKLAVEVAGKMSGTEIVIVILGLGALLGASWSFKSWLNNRKDIKLEEIKSGDHKAALDTIEVVTKIESQKFDKVVDVLKQHGEFGLKALDVVDKGYDALIRAASKTDESVINDVHVDQRQAKALRAPTRPKMETEALIKKVRVADVNTNDPQMYQVVLLDVESDDQYKVKFVDRLLDVKYRDDIVNALKTRGTIIVELLVKSADGDIKSVELKKVLSDADE